MSEAVHDLLNVPRPDILSVSGDFPIDEDALANFSNGTKVLSGNRFRTSA